jgi:hypothetical protein
MGSFYSLFIAAMYVYRMFFNWNIAICHVPLLRLWATAGPVLVWEMS